MTAKLVAEHPTHFELHDGNAAFRVHKDGLSETTRKKIRALGGKKMADGGIADEWPRGRGAANLAPAVIEAAMTDAGTPTVGWAQSNGPVDVAYAPAQPTPIAVVPTQPAPATVVVEPQTAPVAKPAMAKPVATVPSRQTEPSPYALEQQAVTREAEAEAQAARDKAHILGEYQKQLEQQAIDSRQRNERAMADADKYLGDIKTARENMKNISTTVDQGRWWATRSTPQKILGVVGLILGAAGAAKDGVNRAVGLIDNFIQRDIDAQKSQFEMAMRKGQTELDSATSMYGLHRQQTSDDIAAMEAAKATALELTKNRLEQSAANNADPIARERAMQLAAQIGEKAKIADDNAKQRAFDNSLRLQDLALRREELGLRRAAASAKADGGKDLPATMVTELADLPVAQKALDKLQASFKKNNISGGLAKAEAALPDALNRLLDTDVAKYNSDALLAMQAVGKIMEGGKLAQGDEAKYKSILPKAGDSLELAAQKVTEAKDFLQSLYDVRVNALKAAGYKTPAQAGAPNQNNEALQWARANPNDPRAAAILKKLGVAR